MQNYLYPAERAKAYASIGANVDLIADGVALGGPASAPCKRIRVGLDGDIVLKLSGAASSTVLYANCVQGEILNVSAVAIVASGTTATKITVEW